jgi:hypothetical protein
MSTSYHANTLLDILYLLDYYQKIPNATLIYKKHSCISLWDLKLRSGYNYNGYFDCKCVTIMNFHAHSLPLLITYLDLPN